MAAFYMQEGAYRLQILFSQEAWIRGYQGIRGYTAVQRKDVVSCHPHIRKLNTQPFLKGVVSTLAQDFNRKFD